jgi:copper homeostasis protein
MLLEICCYSPAATQIAAHAGAHRIELCDNPGEGGTTPSYGVLKWVRDHISIPVFPIIRPRGGHFCYNKEEIAIMAADIKICKQLDFEGVVIGLLNQNGGIDFEQTSRLVELAWPLEVTFHRAFDRVLNPFESLEQINKAGCHRILTSGQHPTAPGGSELIRQLVEAAPENLIIMPGSGVRASNMAKLVKDTGAIEYHSSAGVLVPEPWYSPDSMDETIKQYLPNAQEITNMLEELSVFENNL